MPELVSRAAIGPPIPTGRPDTPVKMDDFSFDRARQNLFDRFGARPPHWKDVLYDARHRSSIIGSQVNLLSTVQGLMPAVVEFEASPDNWVRATEHRGDADAMLACDIAVQTWLGFRSENHSRATPIRKTSSILALPGEAFGIELTSRVTGKPAVAIVHTKAVEVRDDESGLWTLRRGADPVRLPPGSFRRLWAEDDTFIDDCTSPFRELVEDIATFEIINSALRAASTADLVSRGLVWAPGQGPNKPPTWVNDYLDIVEQVRRDPTVLGGLVPFPVEGGAQPPQFVEFGNIQEQLVKAHELWVKVIARGSPLPAKLIETGPGDGQAYADTALNRLFLQLYARPPLLETVYPAIQCWWWHPRLERNPQFLRTGVDVGRFRLNADIAAIANRPDSRKDAIAANVAGILKKKFVAEQFGATEDDILRPGSPEYDEWLEQRNLTPDEANELMSMLDDDDPTAEDTLIMPDDSGVGFGEPLGQRQAAELGRLW